MFTHGQASNQLTLTQQIKFQIGFFLELPANNLRTTFHDELSEPWQKTPVEFRSIGS
jgi:hypothetical protein